MKITGKEAAWWAMRAVWIFLIWLGFRTGYDSGIDRGRELERAAVLAETEKYRIVIDCPKGERTILYGYFTTPEGELEKGRYPKK